VKISAILTKCQVKALPIFFARRILLCQFSCQRKYFTVFDGFGDAGEGLAGQIGREAWCLYFTLLGFVQINKTT